MGSGAQVLPEAAYVEVLPDITAVYMFEITDVTPCAPTGGRLPEMSMLELLSSMFLV